MSKHIYRTTAVKAANWEWMAEQAAPERRVVFGVDVAKEIFVGALMRPERAVIVTLKWSPPGSPRAVANQAGED